MGQTTVWRKRRGKEIMENDQDGCEYQKKGLTVFVVGASGDLAKKKTYPSLFALYEHGYIPAHATICGYARSKKTDDEFRAHIEPYLKSKSEEDKKGFLNMCIYRNGAYDSAADVAAVFEELHTKEGPDANRLFYFAIPPSVFVPIGTSIKSAGLTTKGWNRLIIEKPFGKDSASFGTLSQAMSALYSEDYIYRIDHYLGKESVQNLE